MCARFYLDKVSINLRIGSSTVVSLVVDAKRERERERERERGDGEERQMNSQVDRRIKRDRY